jgi:hypothetical protein
MSIGELTLKFHQIILNLDWEDKAYRSWYYNILKLEIKDAIMYQKKAEMLDKIINIVSRIESRLIKQHFKKKPWN